MKFLFFICLIFNISAEEIKTSDIIDPSVNDHYIQETQKTINLITDATKEIDNYEVMLIMDSLRVKH